MKQSVSVVSVVALVAGLIIADTGASARATLTNGPLSNAYGGTSYYAANGQVPINAIDDAFAYDPNDPTAQAPGQTTMPRTSFYMTINNAAQNYWGADVGIPSGYELVYLDVWGRDLSANPTAPAVTRTQDLIISLFSGTGGTGSLLWQSTAWEGVTNTASWYARFDFKAAGAGSTALSQAQSLRIDHSPASADYLSLNEVRAALEEGVPTPAITLDGSLTDDTVGENLPVGTLVGSFSMTNDGSWTPPITYTFNGGADDGSFTIDGTSLETAEVFDYATKSSYAIDIEATDSAGTPNTTNASFTITIVDTVTVDVTDFESGNPVGTDGYGPGFRDVSGAGYDTTQGWTWYTPNATRVNDISIPLAGGGSDLVGEQEIRVGSGLELQANEFELGWGTDNTVALRSQSYNVGAGDANVDWTFGSQNVGNVNSYYSQDGGSSWTAFTQGENFTVAAGTLQILLARNDGVNTDRSLDTVTVSYPTFADLVPPAWTLLVPADGSTVPTPSSLTVTFDENIMTNTAGAVTLSNMTAHTVDTIPVGSSELTVSGADLIITPTSPVLANGTEYAVLIDTNAIKDLSGNFFAGITDTTTWNFSTAARVDWTPAMLTVAPAAWFDASDASTITDSGGSVGEWADRSTSGYDLVPGNSPTTGSATIGGLNAIRFDGVNDFLYNHSIATLLNTDVTVVTVVTVPTLPAPKYVFCGRGDTPTGRWYLTGGGGNSFSFNVNVLDNWTASAGAHIVVTQRTTNDLAKAWMDGTLETTLSPSWGNYSEFFVASISGVNQYGDIDMGETVIVPTELARADRQRLEGYLAWKWALQGTLPPGHPYENAPPPTPSYSAGTLFIIR